jgi:hypothetical protein
LVKDLVAFAGTAITDVTVKQQRKAAQPGRRRLLYRRELSEADLDRLVAEIGFDRLWRAVDRATQPELRLAAE